MRRWIVVLTAVLALCSANLLISCSDRQFTAADGLNLHAVAALVKQAQNGEHLEQLLNTSGVNNLDLDGDGIVDYMNVTEYGDGDFRGFSLSITLNDQSVQQIAEIQFQRGLNGISLQIHGNPQIYGHNYYVRSAQPLTLGQVAFLHWIYSPRVVFVSPYSRHYLPPAYAVVRTVPVTTYRTVTTTTVQKAGIKVEQTQKPAITTTVKSPNEGKSSDAVVAPLTAPTQTQKQFQERPETKQIQQASGFGKKKTSEPDKAVVPEKTRPPANQNPAIKQDARPAQTVTEPTTTNKKFEERAPDKTVPQAKGFAPKSQPKTQTR